MSGDKRKNIVYLILIAGRKLQSSLLDFLSDEDAKVVHILYGKGAASAKPSLVEAFGFTPEENKVIITCVLTREKADNVLGLLVRKYNFDKPNTGIAFTINVDGLSF